MNDTFLQQLMLRLRVHLGKHTLLSIRSQKLQICDQPLPYHKRPIENTMLKQQITDCSNSPPRADQLASTPFPSDRLQCLLMLGALDGWESGRFSVVGYTGLCPPSFECPSFSDWCLASHLLRYLLPEVRSNKDYESLASTTTQALMNSPLVKCNVL